MKFALRLCACALLSFFAGGAFAAAATKPPAPPTPLPRPFGRGHVWFHPTAVAPYRFKDTVIRVAFDFDKGIVYGDETATIVPKHGGLTHAPFNTLGIHYRSITVNGKPAAYHIDAAKQVLYVDLPRGTVADKALAVRFTYWVQPQRGIYFIRPDRGYPHLTPEIWSQGEMIDNRRWFPTWDEPNEKTPSELVITVPRGWTAVANGYLKGRNAAVAHVAGRTFTGTTTFDWNSPVPKSTYLIAFAAGPLSEHHTSLDDPAYQRKPLPVDSYTQPPYAKLNALCFGNTKNIVDFFQKTINTAFPWAKYDQITAERFTYGGMENASATIQTARAIHPYIENFESPCDGLVAHELAHQWFGDDVTMSDWSNTWINEGFATYFQELWTEHHFGEPSFEYERYQAQQDYFGETQQYWRPIVDYVYNDPLDLFDASGYPRPGQVLHMLRYMYGDHRFFKALHDYLAEYRHRNADTHQFFDAIDKSLGTNLTWFEDEWFYRAAYPHYYVTQKYDPKAQALTLDVTQKNHDGKPFRMPIVIKVFFGNQTKSVRPTIDQNHQTVTIDGVTQTPQMVLFDPNNNVLRQLDYTKSVSQLAYQLVHAAHVGDRLWALDQLTKVKKVDRKAARDAIREAALFDRFYGVRSEAIDDAAQLGDTQTVRDGLRDRDRRVVIAALQAAGSVKGKHPRLAAAVAAFVNDPDPDVAAAALASLGALKATNAYATLVAALRRQSWREQDASGALRGLAALGDMRAFALVAARTAYGTPQSERATAVTAMTQLAVHAKKPQLVESRLLHLAKTDPLIRTRISAVRALGMLGEASAIPALQNVEANDSQQAVQGSAWNAILDIKDAVAMREYKAKVAKLAKTKKAHRSR